MPRHARGSRVGALADRLVSFVGGEWILTWTPYTANGGTVVTTRAVWLTVWIYTPAYLLRTAFAEGKILEFNSRQGLADFVDTLPWLAAIFAGVYVAFHTRFSSQWTYLAGLYNQIVQTQLTMPPDQSAERIERLAAWKAGFIEDAEELHLATKPMFLVAIRQWASDPMVATKYASNTVGGSERLNALLRRLDVIWHDAEIDESKTHE